ncbi:MAG: S1C family serine protease [Solirubrobacteraceae bacterium]
MKRMFAIPFVSALIGAGVVVAVVAAAGGLGSSQKTVTVVQPAPLAPSNSSSEGASSGLTPHQIYVRTAPGVVFITSTIVRQTESPFGFFRGEGEQQGQATGSGIVIDGKGTILTNWHVVENAVKVTVSFENNQTVEAKVIGKDPSNDLALLHVSAEGIKLHPIPLGDSSKAQVGDPVLAIGNPYGFARTLTTGVVSALQRQITAPNGFAIDNIIQTDAPINPGNSGGPLLNAAGQVIGINSQIESSSGGSVGIGFAVPINTAKRQLPQLEKGGTVSGGYLGVQTIPIDSSLPAALGLPVKSGALVEEVRAGTPAQKAGLRGGDVKVETSSGAVSIGGDIIVSLDGKAITNAEDLGSAVTKRKPGDKVTLGIYRAKSGGGYERKDVEVTLGTQPNSIPNPNTPNG